MWENPGEEDVDSIEIDIAISQEKSKYFVVDDIDLQNQMKENWIFYQGSKSVSTSKSSEQINYVI